MIKQIMIIEIDTLHWIKKELIEDAIKEHLLSFGYLDLNNISSVKVTSNVQKYIKEGNFKINSNP